MRDVKPPEATDEEWESAKRLADAVNVHVLAQNEELSHGRARSGYVAVRLEDGRSPDGVLYDSRAEATRHQDDPWCFYVKVGRQTMPVKEAWVLLNYSRMAKKRGVVFTEEEVVLPQRLELAHPFIPRTFLGAIRP